MNYSYTIEVQEIILKREGGIHDRLLMLKQRLDGFVSLDAGTTTGTIVTKPLIFEGDKLVLNISAEGTARVGFFDEDGRVVSGFGHVAHRLKFVCRSTRCRA